MQALGVAEALAGVEAGRSRVLGVLAIEALLRPLLAAGVDLAAVVAAALVRVGEDVVGGRDLLEAVGDLLVRIEVGVQLLGELAVAPLDLVLAGLAADAEHGVEVVVAHRDCLHDAVAPAPVQSGGACGGICQTRDARALIGRAAAPLIATTR